MAKNIEKKIYVYADFEKYNEEFIGTLFVDVLNGKEIFSFEYDENWLNNGITFLDPDLSLYKGRQFVNDKINFGIFSDSSPDRWGRLLLKREQLIRNNGQKELLESDFLIGVFDEGRMGGLRFKLDKDGKYLESNENQSIPPYTNLRTLEAASINFEKDENLYNEEYLNLLLNPGSSLGGARPKANVIDVDGNLWIAKFPSKNDEYDVGALELKCNRLAIECGINVPEAKLEKFSKNGSTYLSKRFDRNKHKRIHFISAMAALGKTDGETGVSYLDIASFIKSYGINPKADLNELWKRIVFYIAVKNSDDHLRNHGFLYIDGGYRLSPAYDINPNPYGKNLTLAIDEQNSIMDFDLAIDASKYYEIDKDEAARYVKFVKETTSK